ncbi:MULTISPECIES: copper homeostasis membrane protein CopD [Novosphingobium]|uniref:Copper homeostasis membrane protein CopD n=1 Tax=Novosphingobium mangrovi (ex Huang et al. 2023) TaxID=2976432 RepID=A0ABT2I7V1_9SPHN|nr:MULTISPECIES: copper homeostasis membrane protein CopD [Novosphingobium]MCT2400905.1 copper homeostasis membrane protein CopD [Novosphingobium mangrovi (ex Huang et al. 2023)]
MAAVLIRFALYMDLMLLFGLPLFALYGLRGVERSPEAALTLRRLVGGIAFIGLLLSGQAIVSLTASMSGVAPGEVDSSALRLVIGGTSVGTTWLVRIGALLLFLVIALSPHGLRTGWMWLLSLLGAVALSSVVWTGHGAMDEGWVGLIHLGADIIHLLAAGVWVAALLALTTLLFRPHRRMTQAHVEFSHRALASFAVVGTVVVALLVLTGGVNSWLLVGPERFGSLLGSLYGQLLLVKLLLFGVMLGLAAANRFYMTPVLEAAIACGDHIGAVNGLRKTLLTETTCAIVILGLVAWLGMLEPPISGM